MSELIRVKKLTTSLHLVLLLFTCSPHLPIQYLQFEQFSRTLADSAVRREQNLRSTLKAMSEIISGYAVTNNLTWPFVTVPLFEMYGHTALDQGDIELMLVWNRIFPEDREAYQNWTVQHYQEQVQEGHMMRYGNLDRLNNDTMLFSPSIFQFGDRGPEPDVEREEYWYVAIQRFAFRGDLIDPIQPICLLSQDQLADVATTGYVRAGQLEYCISSSL